jgi:hypothetical protein
VSFTHMSQDKSYNILKDFLKVNVIFMQQSFTSLIIKHQDTWKCVVNMDKQSCNRERLFKNRGAQLLHEERDRQAAQKVRVKT